MCETMDWSEEMREKPLGSLGAEICEIFRVPRGSRNCSEGTPRVGAFKTEP